LSKPVEIVKEELKYILEKEIAEVVAETEDREEELKSRKIIAELLAKKDINIFYLLEYKELY
jgi:hypothetical protein